MRLKKKMGWVYIRAKLTTKKGKVVSKCILTKLKNFIPYSHNRTGWMILSGKSSWPLHFFPRKANRALVSSITIFQGLGQRSPSQSCSFARKTVHEGFHEPGSRVIHIVHPHLMVRPQSHAMPHLTLRAELDSQKKDEAMDLVNRKQTVPAGYEDLCTLWSFCLKYLTLPKFLFLCRKFCAFVNNSR
jgi:hypothetical protein